MKLEKYILTFLILIVLALFAFTIFKNLSYPLMWGDETETAMFAKSIVKYGYPKVHIEANEVNFLPVTQEGVGIIKKYDAYVGLPWLQYYIGAIGEVVARNTPDLYQKTFFMRLPFAVLGYLGVVIFPLVVFILFKYPRRLRFLLLFYLLMLVSVPLQLHIREARSYSITIFLYSLAANIFILYFILKKMPYFLYIISMSLVLFFIFFNFVPSYPPILFTVVTFPFMEILFNKYFKLDKFGKNIIPGYLRTILPAIISLVLAIPTAVIFQMNKVSAGVWQLIGFNVKTYFSYLMRAFTFFVKYDYLMLDIFIKFLLILFMVKNWKLLTGKIATGDSTLFKTIMALVFFSYLFTVYIFLICITPYIFDRYYVTLELVLGVSILLGIFAYFELLSLKGNALVKRDKNKEALSFILLIVFFCLCAFKYEIIGGRIYELTNRYVGPLDYSISYLSKTKGIKNMTIEAWHEQTSYMYYLGSRIIYNYYEKDPEFLEFPDVFIYSNYMVPDYLNKKLDKLVKSGKYKKIVFPVMDYPANNIPELSISLRHQFKSRLNNTQDANNLTIYLKNEN